jgi:hypothetical protein
LTIFEGESSTRTANLNCEQATKKLDSAEYLPIVSFPIMPIGKRLAEASLLQIDEQLQVFKGANRGQSSAGV